MILRDTFGCDMVIYPYSKPLFYILMSEHIQLSTLERKSISRIRFFGLKTHDPKIRTNHGFRSALLIREKHLVMKG